MRRTRRCRRVERERGAGGEWTVPPPKRCVGDGRESCQDGPSARTKPLNAGLPAARHQGLETCIRERDDRPLEASWGTDGSRVGWTSGRTHPWFTEREGPLPAAAAVPASGAG